MNQGSKSPVSLKDHQCPGCGVAVHPQCGYINQDASHNRDYITCFLSFKRIGRALPGRTVTQYLQVDMPAVDKSPKDKPRSGPANFTQGQKSSDW
jgi:hypothetical protein